jgi:hypothetical protein
LALLLLVAAAFDSGRTMIERLDRLQAILSCASAQVAFHKEPLYETLRWLSFETAPPDSGGDES